MFGARMSRDWVARNRNPSTSVHWVPAFQLTTEPDVL